MELLRDLDHMDPKFKGGALSVGVFDGVHLGHQRVLARTVERARALDAAPVIFTFHPHPLEILHPAAAPPLIQTFGQKLELMRRVGIRAVVWPEHVERILAMSPDLFLHRVVAGALGARILVEGHDFRFGVKRGGHVEQLTQLAPHHGLEVEIVDDVAVDGERVSSTRIRTLLAAGRVAEAARCLGRPYAYVGTVVEGHHRGAPLGYPTANITAPRFLVPGEGVYAAWAEVHGTRYPAAVSVGRAPTFGAREPMTVEAFLLDFDGELYGEQIAVEFVELLRAQEAFPDAEALKRQMDDDCRRTREVLAGE
jgi:riboflavin kinase/FMN adenylyltransferase